MTPKPCCEEPQTPAGGGGPAQIAELPEDAVTTARRARDTRPVTRCAVDADLSGELITYRAGVLGLAEQTADPARHEATHVNVRALAIEANYDRTVRYKAGFIYYFHESLLWLGPT